MGYCMGRDEKGGKASGTGVTAGLKGQSALSDVNLAKRAESNYFVDGS